LDGDCRDRCGKWYAPQSPVAITPSVSAPEVPVITNIAPKVNGYYDDEEDDEEDDD